MNPLKLCVLIMLFFSLAQTVSALDISEYNITFNVMPDASVQEGISMRFAAPLNASSLNYAVLGDVSGLYVTADGNVLDYSLEKTGSEYNVRFTAPEGTKTLVISFVAHDLVFAGNGIYSFSTSLKPPVTSVMNMKAYLPEGFAVYRDVIYPDGYETLSDGQRICLSWTLENPQSVMLSFKFYNTSSDYSLATGIIISIVFIAVVTYLVGHYRKKMKCEFERGFSEDERKVLFILSKEGRIMQKKIEKELGFSRAKMTRIIMKLEKKGLVEKERVGRTNRLFYKK
ncbi:MAG: MarR family transcriptional regulator [Candidatus Aenigmarchaeota archaeon]|nr:MarR family transcriptional regulator [Candidatus Aenigmarchaeota archaeon]